MVSATKVAGKKFLHGLRSHVLSLEGAINLGFAAMDYNERRKRGASPGQAAIGAATEFAMGELFGWWWFGASLGYYAARGLAEAGTALYYAAPHMLQMMGGHFATASPTDTAMAATMRQRSLAALAQSRMNARSILGSEARMLHRNQITY